MTGQATTAAARPADVLLLFLDDTDSLGISEIARRLQLSKAVVHRIVTAFVERGVLTASPVGRGYCLGPAAMAVGVRATRSSALRAAAQPELARLRDDTSETAALAARVGDRWAFVAQVESSNELSRTVEVGRRFPMHAGSPGLCLLAFHPAGATDHLIERAGTAAPDVRAELAQVRRRGWTRSQAHPIHQSVSLAAPVLDAGGTAVGALSILAPAQRLGDDVRAQVRAVVAAADRASRLLGWRGGLPTR